VSIDLPENQAELVNRSRTDVQGELPKINPSLRNSYIDAIIVAQAGRNFEFYIQLEALILEMFPDTATDDFLERWGDYVGITRNPATQANGNITASGVSGSVLPISTQLQTAEGTIYLTDASATISSNVISVVSVTRIGSIVTVVTSSNHSLASNLSVVISGAVEIEYNGSHVITVTSEDEFTYNIETTPATPASGPILVAFDTASIAVTSQDFGQAVNADSGAGLDLTNPISGVDSTAYVQYGAIGGGTDLENDEDLRDRILERWRNPVALFNEAAISIQAKLVSGVTRVFIEGASTDLDPQTISSITRSGSIAVLTTTTPHGLESGMQVSVSGADQSEYNVIKEIIIVVDDTTIAFPVLGTPTTPATGVITYLPTVRPGQTVVYFTRDNDTNIIPDASEVDTVKDKIKEIKPAHMSDYDLIVKAPVGVVIPFSFTSLTPNTIEVQGAIAANLAALFEERTSVGQDLLQVEYESIIFQSVDPTTGASVSDFTLSTPVGTISIDSGELPVLGSITYP